MPLHVSKNKFWFQISGLVMDDDVIIDRHVTKNFARQPQNFARQPQISNLSLPNADTYNSEFDRNLKMCSSSAIQVSNNLIESNKFYRTNVVESVRSSYDINKK